MNPRIRYSLTDLENQYYNQGNKKPLEDLVRAFQGIQKLPPTDPNSFFVIGGYHGEPFRGAGWGSSQWWGGYCNHGNVLFPTWHRAYCLRIEQALQSIPGCEDVMLPFWDEASEDPQLLGVPTIPSILTQETFELDNVTINNPLKSYSFQQSITSNVATTPGVPNPNYSKNLGYTTVRYPLSGLVGTEKDRKETEIHNAQFKDPVENVRLLNENVHDWLTGGIVMPDGYQPKFTIEKYRRSLDAPNYTVFSNTTSSQQWNQDRTDALVNVPLESPHNDIHLAVGGFDIKDISDASPISGANGDMGENDTAGLDPIFFFHHAFVDRVFWLWQKKHNKTDDLDIIDAYPGTNSVDSQGPTPGVAGGTWLTLDSALAPFKKLDGSGQPMTSNDVVNIETQLGYTYGPGSLEKLPEKTPSDVSPDKMLRVANINRGAIGGSFMVSVWATKDGKDHLVGTESILSRWNVSGCANCQAHLDVKVFLEIPRVLEDATEFKSRLHTRKIASNELTRPLDPPITDVVHKISNLPG
ncbi:hypothetical protein K7432_001770 [Basidiobolus ranarum]|uniref:tyrosinase n=1 Tax=Basidiobolus ranarum TaxID=34480 RepID=A0ABR2W9H3_9FUNG